MNVTASHLCRLLPSQLSELIFLSGLPDCEIPKDSCQAVIAEKVIELAQERNVDLSTYPYIKTMATQK